MDRQSLLRGLGFLVLVFIAAFGGVFAGMKFREARAPAVGADVPESKIQQGTTFPAEQVVEPEGAVHGTSELVSDGAVVLFLRLDCQPCGRMVERWQELTDSGELAGVPTLGITISDPVEIGPYRRDKGLSFPIYHDPDGTFVQQWQVSSVPLVVVVEPGGQVARTFYAPQQIDPAEIRRQVGVG